MYFVPQFQHYKALLSASYDLIKILDILSTFTLHVAHVFLSHSSFSQTLLFIRIQYGSRIWRRDTI